MEKHKRFLVLTFDSYNTSGGIASDLRTSVDTVEEAIDFLKGYYNEPSNDGDAAEIYDRIEGFICHTFQYGLIWKEDKWVPLTEYKHKVWDEQKQIWRSI